MWQIHGLEDCSEKEAEQIKKTVAAEEERYKFIRGGVTAEKLYAIEHRLDGVIDQLHTLGYGFDHPLTEEVHDIRLIIEMFGKQIDPVIHAKMIKLSKKDGE